MSSSNATKALKLYRSILRQHRKLPDVNMRVLGDQYVHHEFQQHAKTTNPDHLKQFFFGWEQYLDILKRRTMSSSASNKIKIGIDIDNTIDESLNNEQKERLHQLKTELFDKKSAQR